MPSEFFRASTAWVVEFRCDGHRRVALGDVLGQHQRHRRRLATDRTGRLADARRREAEDLTFREMFEAWLADGVSREDGNAELRRAFERDVIPDIGDKPVRLVDDSDLRATLRRVGRDRGAGRTAQRMLSELRQLYRWSLSRKPWRALVAEGSPAELVEARQVVNDDYEDGIRDRVLSDAEIHELQEIQVRLRSTYESLPAGHRYGGVRPMKRENDLS